MKLMALNACNGTNPVTEAVLGTMADYCSEDDSFLRFDLHEKTIASCGACMYCQINNPGVCVKKDDMEELLRAYISSDAVIFITNVFCGGYSSAYKRFLDRLCPVLTACFERRFGETWHIPRYENRPSVIGVGIKKPFENTEGIFRELFERNMKQLSVGSYSCLVLNEDDVSIAGGKLIAGLHEAGVKL